MQTLKIATIFLTIFYIYIIHLLIKNSFEEVIEENKKLYLTRYFLAYIIILLAVLFLKKPITNLISTYIAIFIISRNYSDETVNNIYVSLYTHSVILTGEFIGAILLGYLSIPLIGSYEILKITHLIILYASCFIVAVIAIKINSEIKKNSNISSKIYLIIVPMLSIIFIALLYTFEKISITQLSLSTILLFLINITTFKIYKQTVKIITFQKDKELIEEQNNFYKTQISLMKESEEKFKSYRHDMKNHFLVLYSLIEKNDNDQATAYLKKIEEELGKSNQILNSGNEVIDIIINHKMSKIKNLKIKLITEFSLIENLNLSSYDLTTTIGNLLDNAIEASEKIAEDKRLIILKIKEEKGTLTIYVQNNFDGKTEKDKEQFLSTKNNKNMHGYGLKNIKKTVEKNNGICKFDVIENNIFTVLIVFFLD